MVMVNRPLKGVPGSSLSFLGGQEVEEMLCVTQLGRKGSS